MGYYNPIYRYGGERFLDDAKAAGVDGLIIVDLPPEEDDELCLPALARGLCFIRLATPTTDDRRLPKVLDQHQRASSTTSRSPASPAPSAPVVEQVRAAAARLRRHTALPIAVGFGIRTPEQAARDRRRRRCGGGRLGAGRSDRAARSIAPAARRRAWSRACSTGCARSRQACAGAQRAAA